MKKTFFYSAILGFALLLHAGVASASGIDAVTIADDANDPVPTSSANAYTNNYGLNIFSQANMKKVLTQQGSKQFAVPTFDASTTKNIPAATVTKADGTKESLDVWDSWPLQNADGTVATYHGFNIVFALAGSPSDSNDTTIYMFYQKNGNKDLNGWKNAGRVFAHNNSKDSTDALIQKQTQEWSGSATMTKDGQIRLFYTDYSGTGGSGDGNQVITTAQVNTTTTQDEISITNATDWKSIFDGGDGTIYQNIQQFHEEGMWNSGDNHTLRDPHYVEENGKKYLVFEANTGSQVGYQGGNSLLNRAYYGNDSTFEQDFTALTSGAKRNVARMANGALGIIELNDDYSLKKVMKPLLVSNTVTDEIERANVFQKNGKWYLFTDSRGSKMSTEGTTDKDIYTLGFVSDSLTGSYKPLNGSGLVLHLDVNPADPAFTYSHFMIPQKDSSEVLVTSYMTNRGMFADRQSTFAPTFSLRLSGDKTSVVQNSIKEQGVIKK